MGFRVVAGAAVAAHFAFLAFAVLGGFLAWRHPRVFWLQLAAVAWLGLLVAARLVCPLTWIEDRARERAGMPPEPGGFIAHHVAGMFFPHGHQTGAMVVAGAVVLLSWVVLLLRLRARRGRRPAGIRSRYRRSSPDRAGRP